MMVAYLANSVFYNQIYIHWFWTLITIMFVLSQVSSNTPATANFRLSRNGIVSEQQSTPRFAGN